MSKIPKNLTDKDMLRDWVEEESIEDTFQQAEQAEKARAKAAAGVEPPANLAKAGFNAPLMDELGRTLLQLRLELAQKGATVVTYKVKRDGENVVITPKYKI